MIAFSMNIHCFINHRYFLYIWDIDQMIYTLIHLKKNFNEMDIPKHLNALKAFEASARHQSFSGAAQELNITSAAVGQSVRSLEELLGITLFYRQSSGKKRLKLTELAEQILPDIQIGFDYLSKAVNKAKVSSTKQKLTVAISPTFASKWLLPRIHSFQQKYPEIEINFDTDIKPVDFNSHGIDIAVRYGTGHWSGLVAEKLMEEEIFPICSPGFYQNYQSQLKDVESLLDLPLIHCLSMDNNSGFITWAKWLRSNSIMRENNQTGFKINNSAGVLQLAIEGHGIALARSVIACDDLKKGNVMRLYPELTCLSPLAYYIVYREDCCTSSKLIAFKKWLIQETKERQ
ncbi:LysR substrate-binding domain-containing protein [Acinetobacter baumannii]|nr:MULTISPECIES: LysR substrate-binding domain-containing protein [Acinetobacter calcoaceticus/baumannii complex]MDH2546073.1 LysR substrate-binding domain-containing protein [Acinetobacter baumannii]MDH2608256.1 LysR substrate-binding domain-containing protein [Acinetobacter baumannii]MDO7188231.1 LysR substrate-binding domain-containing protein [Acinetobacter baumannii]MDO7231482.1 LysR substrate-binding domain-containing protein [Acinetobacter nosocomialis]MDO7421394.1 LysR substrate-bindin